MAQKRTNYYYHYHYYYHLLLLLLKFAGVCVLGWHLLGFFFPGFLFINLRGGGGGLWDISFIGNNYIVFRGSSSMSCSLDTTVSCKPSVLRLLHMQRLWNSARTILTPGVVAMFIRKIKEMFLAAAQIITGCVFLLFTSEKKKNTPQVSFLTLSNKPGAFPNYWS